MLILISPAKRLDFESPWNTYINESSPEFLEESYELVSILKEMNQIKLEETLHISEKLGKLNLDRFQTWQKNHNQTNSKPAVLAYQGDVFQKFNSRLFDKSQEKYLQQSLRIISGLYGILKPFDLIQPYRLEMKIKLKTKSSKNLYGYWKQKLTKNIQEEIKSDNHKLVINLASQEYSKAIDFDALGIPVYNINFKQTTPKGVKTVMLPTKHSRGMMVDYLVNNSVNTIEDVKKFNTGGYKLVSEVDNELLFVK